MPLVSVAQRSMVCLLNLLKVLSSQGFSLSLSPLVYSLRIKIYIQIPVKLLCFVYCYMQYKLNGSVLNVLTKKHFSS